MLPVIVVVSSPAENSVELSCHTSPTVRKGGRSARFVQQTVERQRLPAQWAKLQEQSHALEIGADLFDLLAG